ncbi:MAG: hypothetical protein AMXMBFR34_54640 [Myxococcaceae bacterium]
MSDGVQSPRVARVALAVLLLSIYGTLAVARRLTDALRDAGMLKLTVGFGFALAGLAVVVTVWRVPELRRPRTLAALALSAVVYGLVVWPMDSPEEKLHFIEYGAVGVLAFLATPPLWTTRRRALGAALFTTAAGWLDEGLQAVLPSRHYDLRDVGFNALAGVLALGALLVIRRQARTSTS